MAVGGQTQGGSIGGRFAQWDFPRGAWQYDIIVGLILIFIFVTPRDWFHDQPKASSVILMSSQGRASTVFIATGLLAGVPEAQRLQKAESVIHQRTGKRWHVVRLEPIHDEAEQETKGFIAYTAP